MWTDAEIRALPAFLAREVGSGTVPGVVAQIGRGPSVIATVSAGTAWCTVERRAR